MVVLVLFFFTMCGPIPVHADCDMHDQMSCSECVADSSSGWGCDCAWNPTTRDCEGDCGDVESGWTRTCAALGPDDVPAGENDVGDDCGQNEGWCLPSLYCDEDSYLSSNECVRCPCAYDESCGRGSDGDSNPAWPCNSQRGDTEDHFLPHIEDSEKALEHALVCVEKGVFGVIKSIENLFDEIEEFSNGEVGDVCESLVDFLEDEGQGEISFCNPDEVCEEVFTAVGEEAVGICDLVFLGICVLNGGSAADPCQWLIDEATGGAAGICSSISDALGLVDETNDDDCKWANDGECDAGIYCPEHSDVKDCACEWENDGECDAGTYCPEHSDVDDCGGSGAH